MTSFHRRTILSLAVMPGLLAGCSIGPEYHTPLAETPAAYKELTPADFQATQGWKLAQPEDDALRGKWWEIFNDPRLNVLEEKVDVSNQTIAAAVASYFSARALVRQARSQFYPTVTTSPAVTEQRSSSSASGSSKGTSTDYTLPFDAPGRRPARRTSKIPGSPSRPPLPPITFNFAGRMR